MDQDEGYSFMRNAGMPQIMEALLARVTVARPNDIYHFIGQSAFNVKVEEQAKKLNELWPEGIVTEEEQTELEKLHFNPHVHSDDQLLLFVEYMLSGVSLEMEISPTVLRCFINVVAANYDSAVPFHNLKHAVAVCQFAFALLKLTRLENTLPAVERLALLVAGFCHDVGHLGLSNSYLSNSGHPLAVRYSDRSVMENHHSSCTFDIIGTPLCNITAGLQEADKKRFRRVVVELILSTDVSQHKAGYEELKGLDSTINYGSDAERLVVLKNLLMMSDLNNEARTFELSQVWAPLVLEEFFRQGDRERAEGLPTMGCMDRNNARQHNEQQFFINHLCLPLYEANANVFPELLTCVTNLKNNASSWAAFEE